MKATEWILAQLESEAPRTRRALERVPEGRDDWKPHEKSMPLGRLAMLVATMPTWINLVVGQDDLDIAPQERIQCSTEGAPYAGRARPGARQRDCRDACCATR